MLPKRPVSCLAAVVIPIGLLLGLVMLGGYALKFFFPNTYGGAGKATTLVTTSTQQAVAEPRPVASRLPTTVATSTRILVATASTDPIKETVFSVDAFGEATAVTTTEDFRPEQWKTNGIVLTPPVEGVTSSAWRVTGRQWNVALKTRSGSVWQDPVIIGQFSNGRLAIVAYRTQRALLSVSKTGDIKVVDVLDDALSPLSVQGTSAWFVRSLPAQDSAIETLPRGPSELVRISTQGTSSTVAQDPALILDLIPSPVLSTIAYLSSDGSLVIVKGDALNSTIKGWRPQVWIDERYLLVSSGGSVGWVDSEKPEHVFFLAEFKNLIRGVRVSTGSVEDVLK